MICYAVIDTNVLVSALLTSKDDSATVQVLGKVLSGEIIPVYLDYEKLAEEYDAIELRNSGAFREPFPTWDCDCIVVMKADKIRKV